MRAKFGLNSLRFAPNPAGRTLVHPYLLGYAQRTQQPRYVASQLTLLWFLAFAANGGLHLSKQKRQPPASAVAIALSCLGNPLGRPPMPGPPNCGLASRQQHT